MSANATQNAELFCEERFKDKNKRFIQKAVYISDLVHSYQYLEGYSGANIMKEQKSNKEMSL